MKVCMLKLKWFAGGHEIHFGKSETKIQKDS